MRLLKQALAVFGTVMLVAMMVALVTPKTAHAIIATAVNAVNTAANPVATVVSGVPFQTTICFQQNADGSEGPCPDVSDTATVPASASTPSGVNINNPELIVEFISGVCQGRSAAYLTKFEGGNATTDFIASPIAGAQGFGFSTPARIYAASGDTLRVGRETTRGFEHADCRYTLHGILVATP
jgi:hypothetical protein